MGSRSDSSSHEASVTISSKLTEIARNMNNSTSTSERASSQTLPKRTIRKAVTAISSVMPQSEIISHHGSM